MTEKVGNQLDAIDIEAAEEYAAERRENIRSFVHTNPDYYISQFDKIGESSRFTPTFNPTAGILGPIWFGARGLWMWAIPLLIIETLGYVQLARGLFGDLAAEARDRIASIEGTLELRRQQLAAAIESQSDKVDVYRRTVKSLEDSIGGIRLEAQEIADQGIWIALMGGGHPARGKSCAICNCQYRFGIPIFRMGFRSQYSFRHATATAVFQRCFHDSDRRCGNVPLLFPRTA